MKNISEELFYSNFDKIKSDAYFEDYIISLKKQNNSNSYLFHFIGFLSFLELKNSPFFPVVIYNNSVMISRRFLMTCKMHYFKIPYGSRTKYIKTVHWINNRLSENDLCLLCVNNIPGRLDSLVAIIDEDLAKIEKIRNYLNSCGIVLYSDKTLKDLFEEMKSRLWNCCGIPYGADEEYIRLSFQELFYFLEDSELEQRGFHLSPEYQPKLFISYSWKDNEIVQRIVDHLENIGLNIWIDKKNIEGGEHLHEAIMKGMWQCDMVLLIISKNYETSLNAKAELKTAFANVVTNKKDWRIFKLDEVDPDRIFPSLSQYKYYSINEENELIESILRGLDKIKSRK